MLRALWGCLLVCEKKLSPPSLRDKDSRKAGRCYNSTEREFETGEADVCFSLLAPSQPCLGWRAMGSESTPLVLLVAQVVSERHRSDAGALSHCGVPAHPPCVGMAQECPGRAVWWTAQPLEQGELSLTCSRARPVGKQASRGHLPGFLRTTILQKVSQRDRPSLVIAVDEDRNLCPKIKIKATLQLGYV